MPDSTVSIVLLSYNRPHHLPEVLASVAAQTYLHLEVTVVDNWSPASGQISQIVRQYPQFRLISNPENVGYTGGMNIAIRGARGHYTFLTEDDMVLHSTCVAELVAFMESNSDVGLASGLIKKQGMDMLHYAGGYFSLGGVYRLTILGAGETCQGQFREPFTVNYITGAMVFARTGFLQGVGGFRNDFFMYLEDVELCARVARLGRPIMVVPRAIAYHFEPALKPALDYIEFHKAKNLLALYLLHAPARVLPEFLVRYGGMMLARQLIFQPRLFRVHLRAWTYTLSRLLLLLQERRRLAVCGRSDRRLKDT